jgi:predicted peroxiredoxin
MRDGAIDHLNGLGTGNLRKLYDAIVSSGVKIYLSGMSSKSRGLSEEELEGKPYEFAMPSRLVQLAVEHDRMFTY